MKRKSRWARLAEAGRTLLERAEIRGEQKLSRFFRARKLAHRREKGRRHFAKHGLLDLPERAAFEAEARRFWRDHYGKDIDPVWHVACARVTGNRDPRFIPHDIWMEEILPFFNFPHHRPAFRDKNLSDTFLGCANIPATVVKRIHRYYHDSSDSLISRERAWQLLLAGPERQIIKGSLTDNGEGVRELARSGEEITLKGAPVTLEGLEQLYGSDFIVQEKIAQHPAMAAPHPESVNTVRLVTFRWKEEIRLLFALARFGTGGRITDNSGTKGVSVAIRDGGRMDALAFDERGCSYRRHPTSGHEFTEDFIVPGYPAVVAQALALHRKLFHFDLVSWDFAIDPAAEPIFLEVNFAGSSWRSQFSLGHGSFGDLTIEVLEWIRDHRGADCAGA